MKIYAITLFSTTLNYTTLTASESVVKIAVKTCKEKNIDYNILEYDVKTQGKNFNDIALPKQSKIK